MKTPRRAAQSPSDDLTDAVFKQWLHRLVKGAPELRALEAGQIDAILDPATGSAVLLPEARAIVGAAATGRRGHRNAPRGSGQAKGNRIGPVAQAGMPNRLLAALPAEDYERLLARLEVVKLSYGEVLYEPGEQILDLYFPSDCVVSLLTVIDRHQALEVGLIGREGLVGARLALGIPTSSSRALVQGTGTALRIGAVAFLREHRRSPALQRAVLLFTDALMNQVAQTAACNRFHVVEARLARWLLMTRERLHTNEFHLTHEFLSDMLGVRRAGVTAAAIALQRRKLIQYRRGTITILDQPSLDAAACSCYQRVRLSS